jgi:hypothetical protein
VRVSYTFPLFTIKNVQKLCLTSATTVDVQSASQTCELSKIAIEAVPNMDKFLDLEDDEQ